MESMNIQYLILSFIKLFSHWQAIYQMDKFHLSKLYSYLVKFFEYFLTN